MSEFIGPVAHCFLALAREKKRLISILIDFIIVFLSLWLSYSLRLGEFYQPPPEQYWLFFFTPCLAIPVFIKFGLYRAIIRYIGIDAVNTVIKAVMLFTLLFAVTVVLSGDLAGLVPRTVYLINAIIVVLLVGGSRMLARWLVHEHISLNNPERHIKRVAPPVLIYGAGQAGAQICTMLKLSRQMNPVAFIDDNHALHRQHLNGLTIYSFQQLDQVIEKYKVADLLLAMPSLSHFQRSKVLQKLEPYPLHIKTLPDLMDVASGRVSVSDIQEVEIGDILGRDPVQPSNDLLHANITDKVVMVTGAGGSIGSELCRQILFLKPKKLILFELCEFNLYQLSKELDTEANSIEVISLLGSVLDQRRLEDICQKFNVATIYHAAAYKHVPLVEQNTTEGIKNNVFGTLRCAQAAINSNVDTFVLISTDKAVRPTNTMGATKRLAEMILQAFAESQMLSKKTRFTMVRFGNVLGSSGSVVPLFREQIAKGGPVTVTHPDIIRYFMTIPEAAELVIQAGAMGEGGDVFVLDMGEAVRIAELAERMIRLSGFSVRNDKQPEGDIAIQFTGLRPGEKLYEELLIGNNVSKTSHPKIMRAQERIIRWGRLQQSLEALEQAYQFNNTQEVRAILQQVVEGFEPQCEVNDWLKSG